MNVLTYLIVFSIIGIGLSGYMTYTHYIPEYTGVCDALAGPGACSYVNTSEYSEILGIPVAILGIIWFIVLWVLSHLSKQKRKHIDELFSWTVIGMVFVGYFIFAEIQLLTVCFYCTLVHIIVLLSFLLSLVLYKNMKRNIY